MKKNEKVGVKKKRGRENSQKKAEKSGREKRFLPLKKTGNRAKNGFHGHFRVSRPKKKNTARWYVTRMNFVNFD